MAYLYFGSAMGAAGGLDGDFALAVGADLGGGGSGSLFDLLLAQTADGIDHLDHNKENDGNNQEVDDGHNESTIIDGNGFFYDFNGTVLKRVGDGVLKDNFQVVEILLEDEADNGGNQILNHGIDDRLEGGADHNANSHINDVAAVDKLFELINDFLQFCTTPLFFCYYSIPLQKMLHNFIKKEPKILVRLFF